MTDLEKKILDISRTHSDYNESLALNELKTLNEIDSDLISTLWTLKKRSEEIKHSGTANDRNSYLAYYLGITSKKPDGEFNLPNRRTYARSGFPDIDMDFDYERRHEIVEYLINKYGRENVGNIGTLQTLKTKAAVRKTIKVLDPTNSIRYDKEGKPIKSKTNENFALENEILKTLPNIMKRGDGTLVKSIEEACDEYPAFEQHMKAYPEVFRIAKTLEDSISGTSCHAGGVALSPIPLCRIAPLHITTDKGQLSEEGTAAKVLATQFPMADIERLGLIKFDILGISTITAISIACKLIKEEHGVNIDWNTLLLDDKKSLDLLKSGLVEGCFQLEQKQMKDCLKTIGMDSFNDLVVAIAMYRPGPKDFIPEFASKKHGKTTISYPHERLRKITSSTYSVLVYQEQIMRVFVELANLPETDGYEFMKGCAKKKPELIDKYKDKFFKGALKQNISEATIEHIWDILYKFSGYSFNMAHAVSYAFLSFKTVYLKAHYPTEFFAARLSVASIRRNMDEAEKYEQDAIENFGFEILPPNINESKINWTVIGDRKLRKPILVKGIGVKAAEEIVKHQPYHGKDILQSFASKVGKSVSSKVVAAMYDCGIWKDDIKKRKKEQIIGAFEQIKKDKIKVRGRPSMDMFA
mgnify:CR=1 FL=1